MTREEHIKRHRELHRALDELLADFIQCNPWKLEFLTTPLKELLEWSYKQTIDPDEPT